DGGRDIEGAIQLVAADPVIPDAAIGVVALDLNRDVDLLQGRTNAHGQLTDPEITVDEVERLAVDRPGLGADEGDVRSGGVMDVGERSPHLATEVQRDVTLAQGV